MSRFLFSILFLLGLTGTVSATTVSSLSGIVTDSEGNPIENVTVGIPSLGFGSYTNIDGEYSIKNIPFGEHEIEVRAVGFTTQKIILTFDSENSVLKNFVLQTDLLQLDNVVVTGTLKEMAIKDSPVKVNVVTGNFLSKTAESNIMEAIQYINGLYSQVDCAVCGTNNIRINGMEGPYTSILIDGMPLMGALSSVYGLNGINPNIIRSLEVIKGPNSTLYGSQAMGGVINIITENPHSLPAFSLASNTNTHSEHNFDFSLVPTFGGITSMFTGSVYLQDRFIDENGDNFADITQNQRISLFNKWEIARKSGKKFSLAGKYYFEDRMGGTENFNRDLRGSSLVYGESIYTNRFELFGSYELPTSENIRLDASFSYHDQDSYYGDYHYVADQNTAFANLIWDRNFGEKTGLVTGLTARYDKLNQLFNGEELLGGSEDERFVPGVFTQIDYTVSDNLNGLVGLRADGYNEHGVILSPRFNVKADPFSHSTVRLNVGTGFRIVNLFTEEHESLTGSREVIVAEELNPERSFNVALNWNQIIDFDKSVINADVDLYYTRFSNQIIPNYDTINQIIYENLDGHSVSRGIGISIAHNFLAPFTYTVGVTFQDVYSVEQGRRSDLEFSPDFNSVFGLTYRAKHQLTFDYTSRLVGRMKLPEYPDRSNHSPLFSEHNLKVTKVFQNNFEMFISGKNLFNYIQKDAIIAPNAPFSEDFATDYVYGPLQGRRFVLGMKISFE